MLARKPARNRLLAVVLLGVAFGMVGVAYAAVPLYALFCRVTGYGGTTRVAEGPSERVLDREVVVRFDANVRGRPWSFRPAAPELRLKVGETGTATYVDENLSDRATTGTATSVRTVRVSLSTGAASGSKRSMRAMASLPKTIDPPRSRDVVHGEVE